MEPKTDLSIKNAHGDYYAVNPQGHLCLVPQAIPLKAGAGWRLAVQGDLDYANEHREYVTREDQAARGGIHPASTPAPQSAPIDPPVIDVESTTEH